LIENKVYDEDIGFLTESQEMQRMALCEDVNHILVNKNSLRRKGIALPAFWFRSATSPQLGF
jgi:hypothetical protein